MVRQALANLRAGSPAEARALLAEHPEACPAALACLTADAAAHGWAAEQLLEAALLPEAEKRAAWLAVTAPAPTPAATTPKPPQRPGNRPGGAHARTPMAKTPSGGPTRATTGTKQVHRGSHGSRSAETNMAIKGVGPGLKQSKGSAPGAAPLRGKQTTGR